MSLLLVGQAQQVRWLEHSSGRAVYAYAVSADGQVVVGSLPVCIVDPEDGRCGYVSHPFRWVVSTVEPLDLFAQFSPYSSPSGVGFGVSAWGDVVVGQIDGGGFRWELEVGTFTAGYNGPAYDVSGDGRVVVGRQARRAFRHVLGEPIEELGTLGGNESEALGTSWDGSVVVGRAQNGQGNWRAFRWTSATGMQDLGVLFAWHWAGVARGVSADGATVVGWTQGFTSRAFRWREGQGMEALGSRAGWGNSFADDVSADGRVVVGWVQVGMEERAVRWREGVGGEDLNEVFGSLLGSGEVLRQALGVSADGRYIVGWGERGGVVSAFWLDTRWAGDVDGDGCVGDADVLAVLFAFGQSGNLPEDVNGDGVVDDGDLLMVLFNFGRGC